MDDVKLRYQPEPRLAWVLVDGSAASCSIVIGVINNAMPLTFIMTMSGGNYSAKQYRYMHKSTHIIYMHIAYTRV